MTINRSYIAAIAILAIVALFFTVGTLFNSSAGLNTATEARQVRGLEVVTQMVHAEPRPAILTLRGRTEAFREVVVRAETGGRVAEAPAIEGRTIRAGETVCRLDVDARGAALSQAEAELRASQLDYDAGIELQTRGHRSANHVASLEAVRDASRARLQAARVDLSNIDIQAPFDGFLDERHAEIGDYLRPGDPCGTIVQLDPILLVAEVSEQDVASLQAGMSGQARLVTGEAILGSVRFVERRADPATRTFRVELEAANPDGVLRSGVTAEISVPLAAEQAHRVPTSVLALNSEGQLGVRIVIDDNIVNFVPVRLLSDDGEQVWVSGLPNPAQIIVLGQDFVADGATITIAPDEAAR
jgi:multidrug efflux system membrane fusion protein